MKIKRNGECYEIIKKNNNKIKQRKKQKFNKIKAKESKNK